MKRKWKIMISWALVSLMLQLPAYYFLNKQIEKVMAPPAPPPAKVRTLKATLAGSKIEDVQISYQKDYLAYKENGVLKVYNLIQGKQVFEKKPAPGSDKNMGVIFYQWLPDRNTLVYFYARKNPNTVTTAVVPAKPSTTAPSSSSASPSLSGTASAKTSPASTPAQASQTSKGHTTQPTKPSQGNSTTAHTQSTTVTTQTQTQSQTQTQTQTTKNDALKTEDPLQTPPKTPSQNPSSTPPNQAPATEQKVETRYNPQITDLYTLELPESDDKSTPPDDRFNKSINSFPAGGQITQMVVSTFTNLMYLTVKSGSNLQLMEIDVMKNVRTLNRSGELITGMAASDKLGTLYIESKTGSSKVIQSLEGWQRQTVSNNSNEVILGDRSGTLYLGEVKENQLERIRSAADNDNPSKMEFKTVWQGSIPFQNAHVVIGTENQIVIYDDKAAYIILKDGQQKQVELTGQNNMISQDGAELVELTPNGSSTEVELKPLLQ